MANGDLTTADVARILGVHRNTVARLVKDGKLNPYRLHGDNGRMRFKPEDVERFREGEDLGQIQPGAIIRNHSTMVDEGAMPLLLKDFLEEGLEQGEFRRILRAADINTIFGRFMKNASPARYSKALEGASNLWIGETYLNLGARHDEKSDYENMGDRIAASKLSIGIGGVDLGGFHKPHITTLIYHAEKGDIVISGTLQQFINIGKGLLIMERKYAEAFFINFKEIEPLEYVKMQHDDTYDEYIGNFMNEVFDRELAEEFDEKEKETEDTAE